MKAQQRLQQLSICDSVGASAQVAKPTNHWKNLPKVTLFARTRAFLQTIRFNNEI